MQDTPRQKATGFGDWLREGTPEAQDKGVADLTAPLEFEDRMFKAQPRTFKSQMREAWNNKISFVPVAGSIAEAVQTGNIIKSMQRLEAGRGTEQDLQDVRNYYVDSARTSTMGGTFATILAALPAFMGEFAIGGRLTTAIGSGGTRLAGQAMRTNIEQLMLKRATMSVFSTKGLASITAKEGMAMAAGAAAQAAAMTVLPTNWGRVSSEAHRLMMPAFDIQEDEADQLRLALMGASSSFSEVLPEALGRQFFEMVSERSGMGMRYFAAKTPVVAGMLELQTKTLQNLIPKGKIGDAMRKLLERGGWHGMIEEYGEERFNSALQAAVGMEPWSDVWPGWQQTIAELGAFGVPMLPGAAIQGARAGARMVRERGQMRKEGVTPEEMAAAEGRAQPSVPGMEMEEEGPPDLIPPEEGGLRGTPPPGGPDLAPPPTGPQTPPEGPLPPEVPPGQVPPEGQGPPSTGPEALVGKEVVAVTPGGQEVSGTLKGTSYYDENGMTRWRWSIDNERGSTYVRGESIRPVIESNQVTREQKALIGKRVEALTADGRGVRGILRQEKHQKVSGGTYSSWVVEADDGTTFFVEADSIQPEAAPPEAQPSNEHQLDQFMSDYLQWVEVDADHPRVDAFEELERAWQYGDDPSKSTFVIPTDEKKAQLLLTALDELIATEEENDETDDETGRKWLEAPTYLRDLVRQAWPNVESLYDRGGEDARKGITITPGGEKSEPEEEPPPEPEEEVPPERKTEPYDKETYERLSRKVENLNTTIGSMFGVTSLEAKHRRKILIEERDRYIARLRRMDDSRGAFKPPEQKPEPKGEDRGNLHARARWAFEHDWEEGEKPDFVSDLDAYNTSKQLKAWDKFLDNFPRLKNAETRNDLWDYYSRDDWLGLIEKYGLYVTDHNGNRVKGNTSKLSIVDSMLVNIYGYRQLPERDAPVVENGIVGTWTKPQVAAVSNWASIGTQAEEAKRVVENPDPAPLMRQLERMPQEKLAGLRTRSGIIDPAKLFDLRRWMASYRPEGAEHLSRLNKKQLLAMLKAAPGSYSQIDRRTPSMRDTKGAMQDRLEQIIADWKKINKIVWMLEEAVGSSFEAAKPKPKPEAKRKEDKPKITKEKRPFPADVRAPSGKKYTFLIGKEDYPSDDRPYYATIEVAAGGKPDLRLGSSMSKPFATEEEREKWIDETIQKIVEGSKKNPLYVWPEEKAEPPKKKAKPKKSAVEPTDLTKKLIKRVKDEMRKAPEADSKDTERIRESRRTLVKEILAPPEEEYEKEPAGKGAPYFRDIPNYEGVKTFTAEVPEAGFLLRLHFIPTAEGQTENWALGVEALGQGGEELAFSGIVSPIGPTRITQYHDLTKITRLAEKYIKDIPASLKDSDAASKAANKLLDEIAAWREEIAADQLAEEKRIKEIRARFNKVKKTFSVQTVTLYSEGDNPPVVNALTYKGLATHQSPKDEKTWVVSHIESGMSTTVTFGTKNKALTAMMRLGDLGQWEKPYGYVMSKEHLQEVLPTLYAIRDLEDPFATEFQAPQETQDAAQSAIKNSKPLSPKDAGVEEEGEATGPLAGMGDLQRGPRGTKRQRRAPTGIGPNAPLFGPTERTAPESYVRETRTVGTALRLRDKLKQVRKELKAAVRRMESGELDPRDQDNINNILEDVVIRLGVARPEWGGDRRGLAKALGYYNMLTESIRIKRGAHWRTFFHEVGHAMHGQMFPSATYKPNPKKVKGPDGKKKTVYGEKVGQRRQFLSAADFPKEWRADLVILGRDLYGEQVPNAGYATEGWAEFWRYLFLDPAHLERRVPKLYKEITELLQTEHPFEWDVIQSARVRMANALAYGLKVDPVEQFIDYPEKPKRPGEEGVVPESKRDPFRNPISGWKNISADMADRFRMAWTDAYSRIHTLLKQLGFNPLDPEGPLNKIRRAWGFSSGDFKILLQYGVFDPNDPTRTPLENTPHIGDIFREIINKGEADLWQDYQVAKRILEKRAWGKEKLERVIEFSTSMSEVSRARRLLASGDYPGNVFRGDEQSPKNPTSTRNLTAFVERIEREFPHFVEASRQFQQVNRWLVQSYLVHYGQLKPEVARRIIDANQEYITFNFVNRLTGLEGAIKSKLGGVNRGPTMRYFPSKDPVKRLAPPLQAWAAAVQTHMSNARLNDAFATLLQQIAETPGGGGIVERVKDKAIEATYVDKRQLERQIREQFHLDGFELNDELTWPEWMLGMEPDNVASFVDLLEGVQGFKAFTGVVKADAANNIVTVRQGGEQVAYEIKDQLLLKTLMDRPMQIPWLLRLPAQWLRWGAVQTNLTFGVGNGMRDMMQALTMSETEFGNFTENLNEQAKQRWRGMREAWMGGDLERLFLASGADMSGIFAEYYDPRRNTIKLPALIRRPSQPYKLQGESIKEKLFDLGTMRYFERLNSTIEQATRFGEFAMAYHQAKSEGKSESFSLHRAGQAAADITLDYQRGGTLARGINQVVPFFNASILGTDKMVRWFWNNPKRAAMSYIQWIMMPTLLQLTMVWDDDEYWAIPAEDRDKYWHFPIGRGLDGRKDYLRIFKPYALNWGAAFVERSVGRFIGVDPSTGKPGGDPKAFKGFYRGLKDGLLPGEVAPAGLKPLLEVMAAGPGGWSFYRGQYIVPRRDWDLPPHMRGAENASDTAKMLNDMFMGLGLQTYSPAKIDHLIQAIWAGTGRDLLRNVADPLVRTANYAKNAVTGSPAFPSVEIREGAGATIFKSFRKEDIAMVRRLLVSEPRSNHEALVRFYDDHRELTEINRAMREMENTSDPRLDWYRTKNAAKLELYKYYDSTAKRLTDLNREIRSTYANREAYTPDQFDVKLKYLYDEMVRQARAVMTEAKRAQQR